MSHLTNKILLRLVLAAAGIVCAAFVFETKNARGGFTPDEVIGKYFLALEKQDVSLMMSLVSETAITDNSVQDRLNRFGGCVMDEKNVRSTQDKPGIVKVRLSGTCTRKRRTEPFRDEFFIEYQSGSVWEFFRGRWSLRLPKVIENESLDLLPAEPQGRS